MLAKLLRSLQRFIRWFFGAPFEELPPEFGDSVPSDLRRFETEADQAQHQAVGTVRTPPSIPSKPTKSV